MILRRQYSFWGISIFFIVCLILSVFFEQPVILLLPFIVIGAFLFSNLTPIWYLLIAVLPLSFEYNLSEYLGLDVPDEMLMILLSFGFVCMYIIKAIQINKLYFNHSISLLLLLCLSWTVISACFSTNVLLSAKYLAAKIWYLIPFVIFPWFILKSKATIRIFAICLLVPIVFTVFYTMFRHARLGFLFDNINNAVVPFYRNHVNYSAMLVCSIPILFAVQQLTIHKKTKNYLLGILLFLLAALFFSYSRGAWVALIVGGIAFYLIRKKLLSYSFLLGLLILISGIYWLAKDNKYLDYHSNYKKTIYHANFNDHLNATFAGTDMSNAERFNRWIAGIRMSEEHFLVGFGPNTFYDNYKPYMVTYFKTWVSSNKEKSTIHNYFLLLLVEQGIPALILFIALLVLAFRRIEILYATIKDLFYKTVTITIGIVLSMIITLNLLSDLIEADKIGSLFYLCLGFIIWIDVQKQKAIIV